MYWLIQKYEINEHKRWKNQDERAIELNET